MKTEIAIQSVQEYGLVVKFVQDLFIMIAILTPKEVHNAIKTLENGLFEWHRLTKKSIEEGDIK